MSKLHWTGAAVLLSLVVLGGGSTRPRRDLIMSWADFARQHCLAADEPTVEAGAEGVQVLSTSPLPPRQRPSAPHHWAAAVAQPRSNRLRADAICGHCGREAGDLEWDAATSWKPAVLRPTGGAPAQLVPSGARLHCAHCGGPVFAEKPEPIVESARGSAAGATRAPAQVPTASKLSESSSSVARRGEPVEGGALLEALA